MQRTMVIAKRELAALFYSPVAYLVLAVFALVAGLLFAQFLVSGNPASLRGEFRWIVWLLAFIAPAVSMRLVSEEMRSGTIELLMTAPVRDSELIVGKWLGGMVFLLALTLPLFLHAFILELNGAPDFGPILTGLLGIVLVGGLYLAIGTLVSAVTDSQLIAFVVTVLITGFLSIGMSALSRAGWPPGWLQSAFSYIDINQQYADFAKGLIDIRNFVYFLSSIALFLFIAVKLIESRRWR